MIGFYLLAAAASWVYAEFWKRHSNNNARREWAAYHRWLKKGGLNNGSL